MSSNDHNDSMLPMTYSAPSSTNSRSTNNSLKESMNQAAMERRKQRRRMRQQEFEKPSPATPDDRSVNSSGRRPRRRTSKPKYSESGGPSSSSNNSGSIIWTILVIGLVFCVADICYIIYFVDRYPDLLAKTVSRLTPAKPLTPIRTHPPNLTHELDTSKELEDKAPILNLLRDAGVPLHPEKDKELLDELPTWKEVTSLYGDKPVIYGLDMCEEFQNRSDPADHFVSTAGTFNTGTNLMAELLIANCHMPARMKKYGAINRGVRWQVPWGKHTPPGDEAYRQSHKTDKDKNIDANNILPAVTIRDPVVWLQSMCRHHYAARWPHDEAHCPDFSKPDIEALVHYAEMTKNHDSILHLWNDWYNEYQTAHFPHLFVRFEDLVFHPKDVTKQVCECAGGAMRQDGKFIYIVDSAKKGSAAHGKTRTGYVDAIVKYGSPQRRYDHYKYKEDLEYIRDHVDPTLMEIMQYPPIDPDHI